MKQLRMLGGMACLLILGVFFPLAGQAASSGELTVQQEYNEHKKLISTTYVDRDGKITLAEDKGYATVRYKYDGNRQLRKTEYLHAEGELTNIVQGNYAVCQMEYDISKRLIQETYLNAEGEMVSGPKGFAEQKTKYLLYKNSTHVIIKIKIGA